MGGKVWGKHIKELLARLNQGPTELYNKMKVVEMIQVTFRDVFSTQSLNPRVASYVFSCVRTPQSGRNSPTPRFVRSSSARWRGSGVFLGQKLSLVLRGGLVLMLSKQPEPEESIGWMRHV